MQFTEAIAIIAGERRHALRPAALAVGPAGNRIVVCSDHVGAADSPLAAIVEALRRILPSGLACRGHARSDDNLLGHD